MMLQLAELVENVYNWMFIRICIIVTFGILTGGSSILLLTASNSNEFSADIPVEKCEVKRQMIFIFYTLM